MKSPFEIINDCTHSIHLAKIAGKNRIIIPIEVKYKTEVFTLFAGQNYGLTFFSIKDIGYVEIRWMG